MEYLQDQAAALRAEIAEREQQLIAVQQRIADPMSWSIVGDLILPTRPEHLITNHTTAKTVGDLVRLGSRELLKIPGFGRKCLCAVRDELHELLIDLPD